MKTRTLTMVLLATGLFAFVLLWWTRPASSPSSSPEESAERSPFSAYVPPRQYLCGRTNTPLTIDGKLDEAAWQSAPWTEDFVEIRGNSQPKPRFRTHVRMLWDDRFFYVGVEMEEPHVWASFTEHDSYIFQEDNDFEVFIDPDGDNHEYAEFEINALNTGWDLLLTRPYRNRGRAIDSWNIPGLKTAVFVDGTLNDPATEDRGWLLEMAFPWKVLRELADPNSRRCPENGDTWRVNFSRVEWQHTIADGKYRKKPMTAEDNWVWSPQGVIDMHRPEKWGYVRFSTEPPGTGTFPPDPAGEVKHLLSDLYYAQLHHYKHHQRWATTFSELDRPPDPRLEDLRIETTGSSFQISSIVRLPGGKKERWFIREDSRVWKEEEK